MKLGLVAPQDNGKTSYLVALYAQLVEARGANRDYPIKYRIKDPVHEATFSNWYLAFSDERLPKGKRFPQKTEGELKEYVFVAEDRATQVEQDIVIYDFPGGFVRGAPSEEDRSRYQRIDSALKSCDAFIVILDSTWLCETSLHSARSRLAASAVTSVLNTAIREKEAAKRAGTDRSGTQFTFIGVPVVFCISKMDLLGSLGHQKDRFALAVSRIQTLFPFFFFEEHCHPVMISGVTVGADIEGPPHNVGDQATLGGPFDPQHIETPFDFCLSTCALSAAMAHLEQEKTWGQTAQREQSREAWAKKMGLFEWVKEWFNTNAKVFEAPEDYWARERRASEHLRDRSKQVSSNYYTIGYNAMQHMDLAAGAPCEIFLGGKPVELDMSSERGRSPFREKVDESVG